MNDYCLNLALIINVKLHVQNYHIFILHRPVSNLQNRVFFNKYITSKLVRIFDALLTIL